MEAQLEQLEGDRVRLTVEVPAGEVHHAVEHATHDLADRVKVPGFRAGQGARRRCSSRGSASSASTRRRSSRTSRAGSGARRARTASGRPSSPRTPTSCRPATTRAGSSRPSSPCRAPSSRPTGRSSRCRGSRSRSATRSSTQQLEALQGTVATLSPVEGRLARDRATSRSSTSSPTTGPDSATTSSSSAHDQARRRDRGGRSATSPPARASEVDWDARRRHDPLGERHAEGALREGAAAARRQLRARGLGVRHARRAPRRASRSGSASCSRTRRSAASAPDAVDELVKATERQARPSCSSRCARATC